ncbi:MAG: CPBP family intramembrane metalloprotease [Bacteroidaceae bacterium]|nr:CPBP family intramembrane metalloprotease [Bacteroidaceae bacterium]
MSKGKELWRAIKLFLLYTVIGEVITGLGACSLLFRGLSKHMSREAIMESIYESNYYKLLECTAYLLIIIIFINNRYVKMSLGRMARMNRRTLWTAIGIAAMIGMGCIFSDVSFWELIGGEDRFFPGESAVLEKTYGAMAKGVLGMLAGAILAPISEEILCRGIILRSMLKMRWHPWVAIPMSALIFSVWHGTAFQTISILPFGIIFGWLYWRTKSLLPCIIIHIVNNAIAFGSYYIPESSDDDTEVSMKVWIIIFAISISLIAFGINWYRKKTQPQYKGISLREGQELS